MSEDVQRVGNYELISKIADGGMAEVFLARFVTETGFEKRVALKKILPHFVKDPAFVSSFTNEARICGKLQHPNVVQVYDFKLEGAQLSLAMEFIEGLDLERVITHLKLKRRVLEPVHVIQIVVQILDGLQYAHTVKGLNVIHRDLKPSNILIDTTGQVKIVDFGVAKASTNLNKTMNQGTAKGTVSYMSPEQASGRLDLKASSDVFSVGCMLYEMLTGNRLFDGDNLFAILDQVRSAPLEPYIQRVPEVFRPVLRRALTRELPQADDPNLPGRYPSAASMRADLVKIIPDAGSTAVLAALVDRLWREGLAIPGRINPGRTPSSLSVPMIERPGSSPTHPKPPGRARLASLTASDQAVAVDGISPSAFAGLPEPAPEETEVTNPRAMSGRNAHGFPPQRPHEMLAGNPAGGDRTQREPLVQAGGGGRGPGGAGMGASAAGPGGWTPPPAPPSVPLAAHPHAPPLSPHGGGGVHAGLASGRPSAAAPSPAPPHPGPAWGARDPYEATAMARDLPQSEPPHALGPPAARLGVAELPTTAGGVPSLGGPPGPVGGAEGARPAPGGWGMPTLPAAGPAGPVSPSPHYPVPPQPAFAAWQHPTAGGGPHPVTPSSGEVLLDMPIAYQEKDGSAGLATRPLPVGTTQSVRPAPQRRWPLYLIVLVVLGLVAGALLILLGVF